MSVGDLRLLNPVHALSLIHISYGVAAVISRDGNIYRINDSSARTGKHVDGNDMLEIVMARDGKVICLWHDCDWNRSSGITSVLWSKAIELNSGDRVLIDMAAGTAPEESSATEETDAIVPVSYTHLDVYKRQVVKCVIPAVKKSRYCVIHARTVNRHR